MASNTVALSRISVFCGLLAAESRKTPPDPVILRSPRLELILDPPGRTAVRISHSLE
ncbi:MAG TPA: hypothetical protein VGV35_02130 [Bryobacteraceae bacterium]|nr:hypothetical protein [Bryobacteraceae bacterium]